MSRTQPTPEDRQWQMSSPEILVKTPIGNMVTSQVRAQRTGKTRQFYRFEYSDWVNIVALTTSRELILINQYRFGTGRIEMEIPGGMVEPGESPLAAGQRELLEETGFAGSSARIIGSVCPNPALQDNLCYTVLVEEAEKIQNSALDEMEDIEVLLKPEKEVLKMIMEGKINHGLVLNGLFFSLLAEGGLNGLFR